MRASFPESKGGLAGVIVKQALRKLRRGKFAASCRLLCLVEICRQRPVLGRHALGRGEQVHIGRRGQGKPAPDVYLEAARSLNVPPSRCLVFEDIIPGIQAGKNAGMTVCAVEDEYSRPHNKEKKECADYFITSYQQVMDGTYEE